MQQKLTSMKYQEIARTPNTKNYELLKRYHPHAAPWNSSLVGNLTRWIVERVGIAKTQLDCRYIRLFKRIVRGARRWNTKRGRSDEVAQDAVAGQNKPDCFQSSDKIR